jgi:hypothetical protein
LIFVLQNILTLFDFGITIFTHGRQFCLPINRRINMNFIAEIIRHDHCRPADQSFAAWKLKGKQRVGVITTEHSASHYGHPVILVEQWGGLLDYSDIKSIELMMPGTMDDYQSVMDAKENPMEHSEWPCGITETDVAEIAANLAPFGIEVNAYGG